MTESVVLSVIGGALGLAFGTLAIRALLSVNTAGLPRIGVDGALVGIDWRVLAFTVGVSLATGIALRPDPGAAELEDRPDLDAQGDRRPLGHRLPPEQDALDPGGRRGGAGADAAGRLGAC